MTIGERIKYRRKVIGITQLRLAELTGIHPVSIRKYETGKMVPGAEQLAKIADALAISYNALSGLDSYNIKLETEGDVTGLLIILCKQGVIKLTGTRDENDQLTSDSFRIVINERIAKLFKMEFAEVDTVKEKDAADISCKINSLFIKDALIKWEHNNFIYAKALAKFGDDQDKEIQQLLTNLKTKIEEAELSLQNTPIRLDGGIKINPNY